MSEARRIVTATLDAAAKAEGFEGFRDSDWSPDLTAAYALADELDARIAALERERDDARAENDVLLRTARRFEDERDLAEVRERALRTALELVIRDTDDELARRHARRALEQDAAAPEAKEDS